MTNGRHVPVRAVQGHKKKGRPKKDILCTDNVSINLICQKKSNELPVKTRKEWFFESLMRRTRVIGTKAKEQDHIPSYLDYWANVAVYRVGLKVSFMHEVALFSEGASGWMEIETGTETG